MQRTPFNVRTARGFTLVESLAVAAVIALLMVGVSIIASMTMNRLKSSSAVEEFVEISTAISDLYANRDSYAGVSPVNVIPKLPPNYVQSSSRVPSIVSPYGTTINVSTDVLPAVGTKPALGIQGVMLFTTVPTPADCVDLVMAMQGSYDYVLVGMGSLQVVANAPVNTATPSTALAGCTAQGGSPTLYFIRT